MDDPSGVPSCGSNRDTTGGGGIRRRSREPPAHPRRVWQTQCSNNTCSTHYSRKRLPSRRYRKLSLYLCVLCARLASLYPGGEPLLTVADPTHDRAKNLGATQRGAAGGSREHLHAWITRAAFRRADQTETLQVVAASGDVRGSRLPTYVESGKPNVLITRVRLTTVESGSPPGAIANSLFTSASFASSARGSPLFMAASVLRTV